MSVLDDIVANRERKLAQRLLADVSSVLADRERAFFASLLANKSAATIEAVLKAVSKPEGLRLFLAIRRALPAGWTVDRAGPAVIGLLASAVQAGATVTEEDARAALTAAGASPSQVSTWLDALPRTADGGIEWAAIAYGIAEVGGAIFFPEIEALPLILGALGGIGGIAFDEDSPLMTAPRRAPALPSSGGTAPPIEDGDVIE